MDSENKQLAKEEAGEIIKSSETQSVSALNGDKETALLRDQYEIYAKQPIPELDRGAIKAYGVYDRKGSGQGTLMAYVTEPALVPRQRMIPRVMGINNQHLGRLISHGTAYWPPAKAERQVFIYEHSFYQPLFNPDKPYGLGWKPERVISTIVKPMIGLLRDMRDRELVHGSISPNNLFIVGSEGNERIILGDCLSAPAGYLQDALCEPIDRMMADPLGRGTGSFEDDIYSLGVILTYALRTRDPYEGKTPDFLLREKIEIGSYAVFSSKERFQGPILDLLRGMLYDDKNLRWSVEEMDAWQDGQRQSPKQTYRKSKASRPITFNDEKYFRPNILANDLHLNVQEAVKLIENDTLSQWVLRSLEDRAAYSRIEDAKSSAQEGGLSQGYAERLLCRVSIALDPESPIRYGGLSFTPEGFASIMAEAYVSRKSMQLYAEVINQAIINYWLQKQNDLDIDVGGLISRFDGARSYIRQTSLGYGLERCLYFMNPDVHCISDKLKRYIVFTPEDLLFALDDIGRDADRPEMFIDRHICAFLAVKDRKIIEPYIQDINAPEKFVQILGNVKVLAAIQKRSKIENLTGLTKWVSEIVSPVYERFHDRELRAKMKERIERLREDGDVSKMISIVDNLDTITDDFNNFKDAMREYNDLTDEYAGLENKMNKTKDYGRDTGREVAAIVSGAISGILILAFSFLFFTKGGPF
jgi:hypothetical protein